MSRTFDNHSSGTLSRAEAETILLLDAVGHGGDAGAIAAKLGLSPTLAPAVAAALAFLEARGLLESTDEGVACTAAGEQLLSLHLQVSP